MREYLNELNSNYTKIIWDMNDTAAAAIGNTSLQCRTRHELLRRQLDNTTATQTILKRTLVKMNRQLKLLFERMGALCDDVTKLRKNQKNAWIASPVR